MNGIMVDRASAPGAVAAAVARRSTAASLTGEHDEAMITAVDHPAGSANDVGCNPDAMADRALLLDRLCAALDRPGVTCVLATRFTGYDTETITAMRFDGGKSLIRINLDDPPCRPSCRTPPTQ